MSPFDWKHPDYAPVYAERAARLARIREHPELLPGLREHYRADPAAFISDWGMTSDPRNQARGLPVEVPFFLFPKQLELIDFILARIRAGEPGLIEKTRDVGASWCAVCLAAALCLFERGAVFGFGSAKEDKIDRSGDPDSLFWKARFFLSHLPPEFRGTWDETRNSAHMRLAFPETGSAIVGEAGDDIGRGGRSLAYFIDEAAHLERPQLIEQSLATNTLSRIDISTPCGRANPFAEKRFSGRVKVFTFRWQDHPGKDAAWYAHQKATLDPVTLAQEVELSYSASVEGIVIPADWVHAAIDAHRKLGIEISGGRRAALDVADEGRDKCAFVGRHGVLLEHAEQWSGKNGDIYRTTVRAINACERLGYSGFDYDADGLGAGVRGDAVQVNLQRRDVGKAQIEAEPFRGSGAVYDPEGSLVEGRLNRDYFANVKAQSWWALRLRFQNTHRAIVEKMAVPPDDIISLDPGLPELTALTVELSQPTYSVNTVGKIVVDKTPDGAMSPNLADAVMIAYAPLRPGAYFGGGAAAGAKPAAAALPRDMDLIFAVIAFADDSGAVVYCACERLGRGPRRLHVLDYDLRVLGSDAPEWIAGVEARLLELHDLVGWNHAGFRPPPPVILVEGLEGYGQLLRGVEVEVHAVGEELPPTPERFAAARPAAVMSAPALAPPAAEKVLSYRDVTRNHLRELLARPEPPPGDPLAVAFATALLVTTPN